MATFTGQLISATYDAIIKTIDNDAIGSTAKQLTDGLGNVTPLYVSNTQIGIGITPTEALDVSGNIKASLSVIATTFSGDLNGTINTATTGVTQTAGNDTTKIATTAFVQESHVGKPTGSGTGGKIALWSGSGSSTVLTDSSITEESTQYLLTKDIRIFDPIPAITLQDSDSSGSASSGDIQWLDNAASQRAIISLSNAVLGITSKHGGLNFGTNSTPALTIDGSQNAAFTEKVTSNSTITTDGGTTLTTKDYVDSVITAQELNFSGTSGTGSVDLDSQTFAIIGTANEIETSAGSQQLQIGLPDDVTIGRDLTVVREIQTFSLDVTAGASIEGLAVTGDSTFSGTITAPTFIGDLNGTINTLTTAVTQSANNNSTKVATTAYVDTSAGLYLPLAGGTLTGGLTGTSATFGGIVTGQVNSNTFGTASASGRALIVQSGSSNQAIMLKNNLGGDGTISVTGTATSMNYEFGTYSVAPALVIKNDGDVGIGISEPLSKLHISGQSGTTGLPSLLLYGESPATGQRYGFNVSADQLDISALGTNAGIGFYTGGNASSITPRLTINSSGNVGIGTSSFSHFSTAKHLLVEGDSVNTNSIVQVISYDNLSSLAMYSGGSSTDNPLLLFQNDLRFGSATDVGLGGYAERMRITSGGNVGIGTDSPYAKLSVKDGTNINLGIKVGQTDTTAVMLNAYNDAVNANIPMEFRASKFNFENGNVGIGTTSPVGTLSVRNTTAGENVLRAEGVAGSLFIDHAGAGNNLYDAANHKFRSFAGVERMRIDSSGNVGIGTDSPDALLELSKDASGAQGATLRLTNSVGGGGAGVAVEFNGPGTQPIHAKILTVDQGAYNSSLIFQTKASGTGGALSEKMRITSGGEIQVGNAVGGSDSDTGTRISATLMRQSTSGTGAHDFHDFYRGTEGSLARVGNIRTTGTTTSYNTSSDYRLKEDLQDFAGLDMVSKIPVYDFKWKTDESRSYGVMAHELQEVLPDAITGDKDAEEMQGVDYSKIVPLLVKSIQELTAKVEMLEKNCNCK